MQYKVSLLRPKGGQFPIHESHFTFINVIDLLIGQFHGVVFSVSGDIQQLGKGAQQIRYSLIHMHQRFARHVLESGANSRGSGF